MLKELIHDKNEAYEHAMQTKKIIEVVNQNPDKTYAFGALQRIAPKLSLDETFFAWEIGMGRKPS